MKLNKVLIFILLFLLVFNLSVLAADSFQGKDKIAFVSDRNGNDDIYIIEDNGENLTKLTDNKEDEYHPIWSPDGSKLIYLSDDGKVFNTTYKLWIMNKDGSNKKMLSDKIDHHSVSECLPAWSPDGSKLLFVTKGEVNKNIVKLNIETGKKKILTAPETEGLYPAWSPDGAKIACFLKGKRKNGLYVMKADGTNIRRLTERGGDYFEPTWSPKGDRIAFVYSQPFFSLFGRHSGVYVVNLDGKTGLRLYRREANDVENIQWDPKGERISFTTTREKQTTMTNTLGNEVSTGEQDVAYLTYVTEVSTNNAMISLAETMDEKLVLDWDSAGEKVAYTDNFSVYVEPVGESDNVSKFGVPYAVGTPKWGPNNNKVVCVGYEQGFNGNKVLYVFAEHEEKVYKLTKGKGNAEEPTWMPRN